MKSVLMAAGLGLMLIGSQAYADGLKVISGNCQLESSQETIILENVDPFSHFGLFAKGKSKDGARIDLTQNIENAVYITITSNTGSSYSVVKLANKGPTLVSTGVVITKAGSDKKEWLSCDLQVK